MGRAPHARHADLLSRIRFSRRQLPRGPPRRSEAAWRAAGRGGRVRPVEYRVRRRRRRRQIAARNSGGPVMRELTPRLALVLAAVAAFTLVACARQVRNVQLTPGAPAVIAELWQAPNEPRDLFHGPGGEAGVPRETAFTFVAEDTTGWSPGFDVRDDSGMEWSVKTGLEAQSEVVASRILWAIGFHQPPTYYVDRWSLKGARTGTQEPGRFRPDLPGSEVVGEWPWHENP